MHVEMQRESEQLYLCQETWGVNQGCGERPTRCPMRMQGSLPQQDIESVMLTHPTQEHLHT